MADDQSSPTDQDDTTNVSGDDSQKHQQAKPPSVVGEEDPFSGDMPGGEYDIDEELGKVGLRGDEKGVKTLDISDELKEEEA